MPGHRSDQTVGTGVSTPRGATTELISTERVGDREIKNDLASILDREQLCDTTKTPKGAPGSDS